MNVAVNTGSTAEFSHHLLTGITPDVSYSMTALICEFSGHIDGPARPT
jgi:hypothetical protein